MKVFAKEGLLKRGTRVRWRCPLYWKAHQLPGAVAVFSVALVGLWRVCGEPSQNMAEVPISGIFNSSRRDGCCVNNF